MTCSRCSSTTNEAARRSQDPAGPCPRAGKNQSRSAGSRQAPGWLSRAPHHFSNYLDGIGKRDSVKNGAELVITIRALAENPQIEIDFCQRADTGLPGPGSASL